MKIPDHVMGEIESIIGSSSMTSSDGVRLDAGSWVRTPKGKIGYISAVNNDNTVDVDVTDSSGSVDTYGYKPNQLQSSFKP